MAPPNVRDRDCSSWPQRPRAAPYLPDSGSGYRRARPGFKYARSKYRRPRCLSPSAQVGSRPGLAPKLLTLQFFLATPAAWQLWRVEKALVAATLPLFSNTLDNLVKFAESMSILGEPPSALSKVLAHASRLFG